VFARAPRLGGVKTRLAASVGDAAALAIYRTLGTTVLEAVRPLSPTVPVVVAFTPDEAGTVLRDWLGEDFVYRAQGGGDLGARMARMVAAAFADGAPQVVVIGTDCPGVTEATVRDALDALERHDVVIGPAVDGGYYLIGLREGIVPDALGVLFDGIPWSSPDTMRTTLERAQEHGLAVALLDEQRDIDTIEDWEAWRDRRD
jgi:rSAM/selenodomain-associated transferase 1